jgi:hypothetical protein
MAALTGCAASVDTYRADFPTGQVVDNGLGPVAGLSPVTGHGSGLVGLNPVQVDLHQDGNSVDLRGTVGDAHVSINEQDLGGFTLIRGTIGDDMVDLKVVPGLHDVGQVTGFVGSKAVRLHESADDRHIGGTIGTDYILVDRTGSSYQGTATTRDRYPHLVDLSVRGDLPFGTLLPFLDSY